MNNNPARSRCRDMLPEAVFKRDAADFQVIEDLGFEPDGDGEHLWIQFKKTGCNTQDVVDAVASQLKVAAKDVGISGLKDKHAITTQWVSLLYPMANGLPQADCLFSELPGVELLQLTRSSKKLRRGVHRDNQFSIKLYDIVSDQAEINEKLAAIQSQGFPNYFGEQRFGINGGNVDQARSMFTRKRKLTRFKKSMYLSAARAWLFNKVLDARVDDASWQQVMAGDVCMLNGTNSIFACEAPDALIQRRYDEHDIHITGPLHGRGTSLTAGSVLELETACLASEALLCDGLEKAGLKNERRALRALAGDLTWNWLEENTLELSFSLQRGAYATALLGEIVQLQQEYKK